MTMSGGWNFDQELLQWQASISSIQPSVYIIRLVYSTLVLVEIANLQKNNKPCKIKTKAYKYESSV
jgi:hypothetical protein